MAGWGVGGGLPGGGGGGSERTGGDIQRQTEREGEGEDMVKIIKELNI